MSALFNPLKLGSTTIPNRLVCARMSALTRNQATATVPNEIMLKYYVQCAKGSVGWIITKGVLITRQGSEWPEAPGIWEEAQVKGWKKINAVHEAGSKIYAQLWHLGRLSHPDAPQQIKAGVQVYGPSTISACSGKFHFIAGEPGYVTTRVRRTRTATSNLASWAPSNCPPLQVTRALRRETPSLSQGYRQGSTKCEPAWVLQEDRE
ncbi:hypothetical protein K438DRAFT_1768083 [Mycena galopus ATCC 62051]|nr:hypothetical protein K438DRAFT_1768083 [Mycena galopus ATCC 62051]